VIYGSILYFLVPCHLFVAFIIELAAAQQAKAAVGRAKKAEKDKAKPNQTETERRSFRAAWYWIAFAHGINASMNLAIATWVVYYTFTILASVPFARCMPSSSGSRHAATPSPTEI